MRISWFEHGFGCLNMTFIHLTMASNSYAHSYLCKNVYHTTYTYRNFIFVWTVCGKTDLFQTARWFLLENTVSDSKMVSPWNYFHPTHLIGSAKKSEIILKSWYLRLSWENLFLPYANNKGADKPAHSCSLISTFVFRCLDCIIPLVSISKISSL